MEEEFEEKTGFKIGLSHQIIGDKLLWSWKLYDANLKLRLSSTESFKSKSDAILGSINKYYSIYGR